LIIDHDKKGVTRISPTGVAKAREALLVNTYTFLRNFCLYGSTFGDCSPFKKYLKSKDYVDFAPDRIA